MICILVGTNRAHSKSYDVAAEIHAIYKAQGHEAEILELAKVPLSVTPENAYSLDQQPLVRPFVNQINRADGVVIVCPEYNGSFPGILKYFIDHWSYPASFEARPFCLVGLGGRFGGVRPVEHLQQVFGYRSAYVFPQRVFLFNVGEVVREHKIADQSARKLLEDQASGFVRFIRALKSEKLDAQSVRPSAPTA